MNCHPALTVCVLTMLFEPHRITMLFVNPSNILLVPTVPWLDPVPCHFYQKVDCMLRVGCY